MTGIPWKLKRSISFLKHVCAQVFCSAYLFALKTDAICSNEMSVGCKRSARHYIPEDNCEEPDSTTACWFTCMLNGSSPLHCGFPGMEIICYHGNSLQKHLLSFSSKAMPVYRGSYRLGCSATESARLYILCSLFRWQHKPQAHSIGLFRPARLRVLGSFSSYTLSVEGGIGYMRLGIPKRIRLCVDSRHTPHENGWWVHKKVIFSIHFGNNLFSFRC